MINRVILMGRLTRNPEIRYAQGSNMAIARFSMAIDRDYQKEGEERKADFPSCIAFDKKAEFIEKYFKQGSMIAIEGHIQTGSYDKDDTKVYTTDVIVDKVSFTGEKKADSENTPQGTPQATPSSVGDGFMNVADSLDADLPWN